MEPATVTIRFDPLPLRVRLRRGAPKIALACVLVALLPVVVVRGPALLGPGNGSVAFDRLIAGMVIGFPLLAMAFATLVSVLKPGRGCNVMFSEHGLHELDAACRPTLHPWSFVAAAIEDDANLELRCGYGLGRSVATQIPTALLLARGHPEFGRLRGMVAAQLGPRFVAKKR